MPSRQFPQIAAASIEEHAELIKRLREKNPAAAEFAKRAHLETGKQIIFASLEPHRKRPSYRAPPFESGAIMQIEHNA